MFKIDIKNPKHKIVIGGVGFLLILILLLLIYSALPKKDKITEPVEQDVYQENINTTDEVDSEFTEEEVVTEEIEEEIIVDTPTEDVYVSADEPFDLDLSLLNVDTAEAISDPVIKEELMKYLEVFYYNYYFPQAYQQETGEIDARAMTLFALSYIMQHEPEELKFDHETYELYIPKENVVRVVERFFYRELQSFTGYEDLNIQYVNGEYIVVVEIGVWEETIEYNSLLKWGDFTYKVGFNIKDENGIVIGKIEAIVDKSENNYVLVNYRQIMQ